MRILYLGDDYVHCTSAHRAAALGRLGHDVVSLNPQAHMPQHLIVSGFNVRTGYRLFAHWVSARLKSKIKAMLKSGPARRFDLVWIDGCPELPPSFYLWLRSFGFPIVCYNIDDPFGKRDRRKWDLLKQSVPHIDLMVVVRNENVAEARQYGARQVLRVYRSYDPVAHAPFAMSAEEEREWSSEVAFVGTWMPERGPFMGRLLDLGVPLSIWGHSWHKAKEWPRLKKCWRGPPVGGTDYVKAIQGAKILLGLLSKGNRDLHTTRSAEVPFIGGAVLCAERTVEHEEMFSDGREVLLWGTAEECAVRCNAILADKVELKRLAENARRRVIQLRLSNDDVLDAVLAMLKGDTGVMEPVLSAHSSP